MERIVFLKHVKIICLKHLFFGSCFLVIQISQELGIANIVNRRCLQALKGAQNNLQKISLFIHDTHHSVQFYHFLSHFEIYARKSKSRPRIERSNIENVFEVLFACVNLDWRWKFSYFSEKIEIS